MKAVVCTKIGDPNLLEIKDIETPKPSKNEVLIKVQAAGVNFPDALMVQGKYQIVMDPPFTPGNEVCGYVEETGDDVDLKIGTKVIALPPIGGFSEYVSVDKNLVIPVSEKVDSMAGASLPINYGTCYYALKRRANIQKNESLLVLGASGGIAVSYTHLTLPTKRIV